MNRMPFILSILAVLVFVASGFNTIGNDATFVKERAVNDGYSMTCEEEYAVQVNEVECAIESIQAEGSEVGNTIYTMTGEYAPSDITECPFGDCKCWRLRFSNQCGCWMWYRIC